MLQIRFATGNAAFEDENTDEVAERLIRIVELIRDEGLRSGKIRDANGNKIGDWSLSFED